MTTIHRKAVGETIAETDSKTRLGGIWLAVGSLFFVSGSALLFVGGVLQVLRAGRRGDSMAMAALAGDPTLMTTIHGVNAIALAVFAVAGLVVLTARSRLTRSWWTASAWAVLVVSTLMGTTGSVSIATVLTGAAVAGDAATFETWLRFVSAYHLAVAVFGLAIAVIAGHEARRVDGVTPTWAAWLGAVAGVGVFAGITLAFGFGIRPSGWLIAAFVMGVWTLWFGVTLARTGDRAPTGPEEPAAGGEVPSP